MTDFNWENSSIEGLNHYPNFSRHCKTQLGNLRGWLTERGIKTRVTAEVVAAFPQYWSILGTRFWFEQARRLGYSIEDVEKSMCRAARVQSGTGNQIAHFIMQEIPPTTIEGSELRITGDRPLTPHLLWHFAWGAAQLAQIFDDGRDRPKSKHGTPTDQLLRHAKNQKPISSQYEKQIDIHLTGLGEWQFQIDFLMEKAKRAAIAMALSQKHIYTMNAEENPNSLSALELFLTDLNHMPLEQIIEVGEHSFHRELIAEAAQIEDVVTRIIAKNN